MSTLGEKLKHKLRGVDPGHRVFLRHVSIAGADAAAVRHSRFGFLLTATVLALLAGQAASLRREVRAHRGSSGGQLDRRERPIHAGLGDVNDLT